MSYLTTSENIVLLEILRNNEYLRGTKAVRDAFLSILGLKAVTNELSPDSSVNDAVVMLIDRLVEKTFVQGGEKKFGLVFLLEGILEEDGQKANPELSDDHQTLMKQVIQKGKAWLESAEYKQKQLIGDALENGLAGVPEESEPLQVRYKVDKGLITDFDMEDLTDFISQGTKKYEGLVTFLLEGFEDGFPTPIERYFLERILSEIKARKKNMSWCIYDIPLSEDDLGSGEDWIERKLVNMLKYERVDDLFSGAHQNIVLCIINNDIPVEVTAKRIVPFWNKIQAAAPTHLENKGRLLVLIFLDTGAGASTGLEKLPLPGKFDVTSLCAWLHANLLEAQVPEDKIAAYKKRLSKWNGQVLNTYTEMDGIIKELRGG